MRHRELLSAIAALLVPFSSTLAQADGEMLPGPLVHATLAFASIPSLGVYGLPAGDPIVSAGIPATVTRLFSAPPGAKVLGSVTWLRELDVYGTASGTIATFREWFANDLAKRGYQAVDENTRDQAQGGFRDPRPARFQGYCAGPDLIAFDARPSDINRVEYRVRTTFRSTTCTMGSSPGSIRFGGAPDLPTLENPINASLYNGGGAGCQAQVYGSGHGTGVDLATAMTPLELIQHYEKQMPASGWTHVNAPSDATSIWSRKDSTGKEQLVVLQASASRVIPNCRNVQMMLYDAGRTR